ncbi:hypothetical protein [Arenimonas sp.]
MAKKMLIGVAAVFIALALAQAGYSFGKHLAKQESAASPTPPATS